MEDDAKQESPQQPINSPKDTPPNPSRREFLKYAARALGVAAIVSTGGSLPHSMTKERDTFVEKEAISSEVSDSVDIFMSPETHDEEKSREIIIKGIYKWVPQLTGQDRLGYFGLATPADVPSGYGYDVMRIPPVEAEEPIQQPYRENSHRVSFGSDGSILSGYRLTIRGGSPQEFTEVASELGKEDPQTDSMNYLDVHSFMFGPEEYKQLEERLFEDRLRIQMLDAANRQNEFQVGIHATIREAPISQNVLHMTNYLMGHLSEFEQVNIQPTENENMNNVSLHANSMAISAHLDYARADRNFNRSLIQVNIQSSAVYGTEMGMYWDGEKAVLAFPGVDTAYVVTDKDLLKNIGTTLLQEAMEEPQNARPVQTYRA